jgi:flavin-dependent dehydrogenase
VEVHLAEGMELYLTPTGPAQVNLALLVEKDHMAAFRGDAAAGVAQAVSQCDAVAAHLQGARATTDAMVCGPLRQAPTHLVADRGLLVGDAAGFIDAITGEGMSLGLLTAELATTVLSDCLHANRLGHADLWAYHLQARRRRWQLTALTRIVLWGIRHRVLARRIVGNLARHPDVFSRVLAVTTDQQPLAHVGVGGLRILVLGW